MIKRELTLYPDTERTRDLVYSEYGNRGRSIHVLLQEGAGPGYEFLLQAYREIVSQFCSASTLRTSLAFVKHLVDRLDEMWDESHAGADEGGGVGIHVVLRDPSGSYVLTSRDDTVYAHCHGELARLSESGLEGAEQIAFDDALQKDLFPQRFRDRFSLYRLDPILFGPRDLLLGCGEEDKGTVVEVLSDPSLSEGRTRTGVASRFLTRKLLVLRFHPVLPMNQWYGSRASQGGVAAVFRKWSYVGVGVAAAAIVGVAIWASDLLQPSLDSLVLGNQSEAYPDDVEAPGERPVVPPVATDAPHATTEAEDGDLKLTEAWKKGFQNAVTSSPMLLNGCVIFGCRDGYVYALERETGQTLWKYQTSGGVGASPAAHAGNVVAADYGGNVFALDAGSGERRWVQKLPAKIVSSPFVLEDRILVGCYDGYAYCLSGVDGRVLWKHRTGSRIRASATGEGDTFYVPSYDGFLYALSAGTGEVRWRYHIKGSVASSPAANEHIVVIGAPGGSVYCLEAPTGKLKWTQTTRAGVKSAVSIKAGRVFVGSNDRNVYCLSAQDGSVMWKYATGDVVLSRPHVRDGVVYVGSYDGIMYCLQASSGDLRDKFDTGGAIYSSPVTDDNSVYFGTNEGTFICLTHNGRRKAL